jgi:hypothetical protein
MERCESARNLTNDLLPALLMIPSAEFLVKMVGNDFSKSLGEALREIAGFFRENYLCLEKRLVGF